MVSLTLTVFAQNGSVIERRETTYASVRYLLETLSERAKAAKRNYIQRGIRGRTIDINLAVSGMSEIVRQIRDQMDENPDQQVYLGKVGFEDGLAVEWKLNTAADGPTTRHRFSVN